MNWEQPIQAFTLGIQKTDLFVVPHQHNKDNQGFQR